MRKKIIVLILSLVIILNIFQYIEAKQNDWNDLGIEFINGEYDFNYQVKEIIKVFDGINPPKSAFEKPSLDDAIIEKKQYLEWLIYRIAEMTAVESYVHEITLNIEGWIWVSSSVRFNDVIVAGEYFNKQGHFPKDVDFNEDLNRLKEAKLYAKSIENQELYEYLNQTLYLYDLAMKNDNYYFYGLGQRRMIVLNKALGNE